MDVKRDLGTALVREFPTAAAGTVVLYDAAGVPVGYGRLDVTPAGVTWVFNSDPATLSLLQPPPSPRGA